MRRATGDPKSLLSADHQAPAEVDDSRWISRNVFAGVMQGRTLMAPVFRWQWPSLQEHDGVVGIGSAQAC